MIVLIGRVGGCRAWMIAKGSLTSLGSRAMSLTTAGNDAAEQLRRAGDAFRDLPRRRRDQAAGFRFCGILLRELAN
jgi:hypothetical protein